MSTGPILPDDPPLTPCLRCHTIDNVSIVTRLDYFVYLRCGSCGEVWSIGKPSDDGG